MHSCLFFIAFSVMLPKVMINVNGKLLEPGKHQMADRQILFIGTPAWCSMDDGESGDISKSPNNVLIRVS